MKIRPDERIVFPYDLFIDSQLRSVSLATVELAQERQVRLYGTLLRSQRARGSS